MSIDGPRLSSTSMLVQRLLWYRTVGERPRPLPVVVLLGPVGAGKSEALRSISADCGAGVVHASFDFEPTDERTEPVSPVEVLARIAFDLSREWKARRAARFTRFALGMIAVQMPVNGMSREQAKENLRTLIEEFAHNPKAGRIAAGVGALADSARTAGIFAAPVAETVKGVLPRLIRTITRKPLSAAKQWHADIPEAEGAEPLDALVSLSQRAREHPAEMTTWLTEAFLADVRESHPQLAVPDERSPCNCDNPRKLRHWHNWVLLLDNIDREGGSTFVSGLLSSQDRHLRDHPDSHDPLLVVATSGRWDPAWEAGWRAPWRAEPDKPDRVRAAPQCRNASYEHWIGDPASEPPHSRYYPVRLEPLSIDETARILGIRQHAPVCDLAQRATGGLPAAVHEFAELLGDRKPRPGARDVLGPANSAKHTVDPWRSRLGKMAITRHLPDLDIDAFVTAAPFATAPWLVPAEATSLVSRPHIGRILTELRTALWVTAPARGGGTADYAELHPWIARTLMSALAGREPDPHHPSYSRQLEALLKDSDTIDDPARTAYCQLALGQISVVVDAFEDSFDRGPHQEWIARLRLTAHAPDNLPLGQDCGSLYQELVDTDILCRQQGRSPVGNIVARLVAAIWLAANPFTMLDPNLKDIIVHAYRELPPLSRRPDVAALHIAAELAARGEFL